MAKTKIAIVDNHNEVRKMFAYFFDQFCSDFSVTLMCSDGHEFIQSLSGVPLDKRPDIVLMDLSMSPSGFEMASWIKNNIPDLKVIFLTVMRDKLASIDNLIKMGVYGYLSKFAEPREMEAALSKVRQGERHFSKELTYRWSPSFFERPQSFTNSHINEPSF